MKNVNLYLAEGFEEIEAVTVADVLRRADIGVSMVSVTGRKEVKGAHGIIITADELFEKFDNHTADMIILPGGMPGTRNLGSHAGLKALIMDFAGKNKPIAAICAAPSVIGKLGLYKNKKAACYPGFEDTLEGAILGDDIVVRDENLITSKGPGTAIYFALNLVEFLAGKDVAMELHEGMIVQGEY
ncbi:MAG: DJ-1 family glyoxalase III [Caulobacteraceae bacterium]